MSAPAHAMESRRAGRRAAPDPRCRCSGGAGRRSAFWRSCGVWPSASAHHRAQRRLSLGPVDCVRRRDRHGAGVRRLRDGDARLRDEPRPAITRWCVRRCSPARSATRWPAFAVVPRRRPLLELLEGAALLLALEPQSVLLEVALCIMAYVVVLWIELAPAFLTRGATAPWPRVRRFSMWAQPRSSRALIWIVALGLLLPTMHQSSLGSLMLLAGPRLHPLWNTPLLPLLFLISCVGMGYAAVVIEGAVSSLLLKREPERAMLAGARACRGLVVGLVPRAAHRRSRRRAASWRRSSRSTCDANLALIELALFARRAADARHRRAAARSRQSVSRRDGH